MNFIRSLTFFQLSNIILITTLAVLFSRYLWLVLGGRDRRPAAWRQGVKTGQISPALHKLRRRYPDKVRFYTFWFQVMRLEKEQVPGVFAEVGVYKGESARVLKALAPSRVLHLFDTFSGFPASDLAGETGEAATYTTDNFRDTSVSAVLARIGGTEGVVVHEGYFPATAGGFSLPVALVSLDADLYAPTRAALDLFYPLLSPGGVILVHDYNAKWPGILRAVDEFAATVPETPVFLPDTDGTVLFVRNR
jgi:O-methyltransferase